MVACACTHSDYDCQSGRLFLRPVTLTATNFAAHGPTEPILPHKKILTLLKNLLTVKSLAAFLGIILKVTPFS